jgi:hypothetical protein
MGESNFLLERENMKNEKTGSCFARRFREARGNVVDPTPAPGEEASD